MEAVPPNAWECLKTVFKEGGFKGLYRGMVPNSMKVIPATSISYAMYGYLDGLFSKEKT